MDSEHEQPAGSLTRRPVDLPGHPGAFVGRVQQVAEVAALLRRDDTRLVTLTGASGVGKTRLLLQVAADLADAFPDGSFPVALASVADTALVGPSIALALSVPEIAGHSALDSLSHQLASKRALLVLDDFGQWPDAAPLLARLMTRCTQLKAVITGREPLGLPIEREYPVPPMQLPRGEPRARGLPECEAVQLFVTRLREAAPGFELTSEDAAAIERICARLDGLPLALELAAARASTLGVQAVATDLATRVDLPAHGTHDSSSHQRTLHAALDWSYALLDAEQQALFRHAAVFAGGFDIDSAEQVLAIRGQRVGAVRGQLASLVDSGLVARAHAPRDTRLHMLQSVRAYGLAQLTARGEDGAAHDAHARHFLAMAERHAPELIGKDQRRSVQRLLLEADNLRAALSFALARNQLAGAARTIQSLLLLWIPRGLLAEGMVWVERALQACSAAHASRDRALLLDAAAQLAIACGDHTGALRHAGEALAILEQGATPSDLARATMTFGVASAALGRIPEGAQFLIAALTMYRDLNDPHGTALALVALGQGARASGDELAATGCHEEALSLLQAIGHVYGRGQLLQNLAHFRLHEGDWKGAALLLAEVLELGREYDYPGVVNLYLAAMGGMAVVRGRAAEGARLLGAVSAALQLLGATFEPSDQQELERHMASARSELGDEAFEQAFAEGSHWSLDRAIAATLALRG